MSHSANADLVAIDTIAGVSSSVRPRDAGVITTADHANQSTTQGEG